MMNKLSEIQLLQLKQDKEMYFRVGSCTSPADRGLAEKAITGLYNKLGKSVPKFVWAASPASAVLYITQLQQNVFSGTTEGSLAELKHKTETTLGSQFSAALQAAKNEPNFWGNIEIYWQAFYDFPRKRLGVQYETTQDELLTTWMDISASCGWWWAFDTHVVISDRPKSIHWDFQGPEPRLHHASKPAVQFRDGWSVFCWRGVTVPREWILNANSINPALALTHPNVEQRRCLAEILGWKKVLEQVKARTIDIDNDPQVGTLIEADLPGAPRQRFLKVICATAREFVLPVPGNMKTAKQAQAWTWGVESKEAVNSFQIGLRT